jgi:hypothetical protein
MLPAPLRPALDVQHAPSLGLDQHARARLISPPDTSASAQDEGALSTGEEGDCSTGVDRAGWLLCSLSSTQRPRVQQIDLCTASPVSRG